jgi:CheY-like chemotaxis protein
MQPNVKTPGKRGIPPGFGRILVVEDDGLLAMAIEQALLDAGAGEVVLCNSTDAALAALRVKRPDAIILDVHLADRDDGWAIAELVDDIGPNPPRIVFSTGAPQDIPPRIAEMGPILVKPYDPAELIEAIRGPERPGILERLRRTAQKPLR